MGNVYLERRIEEKIVEARAQGKHNLSVPDFVKSAVKEKLRKLGIEIE